MTNPTKKPALIAYAVTDTGDEGKSFFNRIGVAWANSKGGYKIILAATPVNGEILLLPPKDKDED